MTKKATKTTKPANSSRQSKLTLQKETFRDLAVGGRGVGIRGGVGAVGNTQSCSVRGAC